MDFFSPIIKQDNEQLLCRHVNATPAVDGYGHESFVISPAAGSHVRFSAANSAARVDRVLRTLHTLVLPSKLALADDLDDVAAFLGREAPTVSPCLAVFDGPVDTVGASVAALLSRTGGVVALATVSRSLRTIHHDGTGEECRSCIPLVAGLDASIFQRLSRTTTVDSLLLPLRYGCFSRDVVPATLAVAKEQRRLRLVADCTQRVDKNSPFFPGPGGRLPLSICGKKRNGCGGCASDTSYWFMSEDIGCHVDAPRHFYDDQRSISDLTENDLALCPAVIVDISARAGCDPDATVQVEDLLEWEKRAGKQIPPRALIVMMSGWSGKFASDPKGYVGQDPEDEQHKLSFPGFSKAAAEWLVNERPHFAGLGVDTLSVDAGNNADFDVHQVVLRSGRYWHIENMDLTSEAFLKAAEQQFEKSFSFVTAPLRIEGAYEAPCRCVMVEEL